MAPPWRNMHHEVTKMKPMRMKRRPQWNDDDNDDNTTSFTTTTTRCWPSFLYAQKWSWVTCRHSCQEDVPRKGLQTPSFQLFALRCRLSYYSHRAAIIPTTRIMLPGFLLIALRRHHSYYLYRAAIFTTTCIAMPSLQLLGIIMPPSPHRCGPLMAETAHVLAGRESCNGKCM